MSNRIDYKNNNKTSDMTMKEMRKNKKSGFFLFLLLSVVVIFTAYAAYLKTSNNEFHVLDFKKLIANITADNPIDEEEPKIIEIKYDAKDKPIFEVYKSHIIKCTLYSVTSIDKKGEEQWSIPILLNKPLMQSNGSKLFIADIGGRALYIIEGGTIKWQTSISGDIINAHINEKGYISVVHEAEGYASAITTFDPSGQEIFKRYIVDTFILSCQVSPSQEHVIINGLDVSGANVSSHVEFTDLLGNPFAALVPKQGEIYPFLLTLKDNSFTLINDDTLIYYDTNREKIWENKYRKIYAAGIIEDRNIVVAAKKDGTRDDDTEVYILNKEGKETRKLNISGKVYNMALWNDIVAVNNKREVYFINSRGNLEKKYTSISDVDKVIFFSNNEAALITKNSIIILKI